ncbi:hypothetical protein SynMITS9220_02598 [Synechococcus sp. MIT S9220]|nr:hypothetical protein SynMITS9220_02598 [Synechococcus sp. MIT S9220]
MALLSIVWIQLVPLCGLCPPTLPGGVCIALGVALQQALQCLEP